MPNSKLTVGKKQLGADGKLWVAFPDNSEQDITVTAAGVHHYNASATASKVTSPVINYITENDGAVGDFQDEADPRPVVTLNFNGDPVLDQMAI